MGTYVYLREGAQGSQECPTLPAAEVTGGCQPSPAGTGIWTWASVRAVSAVDCWALSRATAPLFLFLCVWVFYFHACMCTVCIPGSLRGQKRGSHTSPGTEVKRGCEPSRRCWESNLSCQQEQQMTLTFLSHLSSSSSASLFFLTSKILRRYHYNTTANSCYLVPWWY